MVKVMVHIRTRFGQRDFVRNCVLVNHHTTGMPQSSVVFRTKSRSRNSMTSRLMNFRVLQGSRMQACP